jgi:hypothetical protein
MEVVTEKQPRYELLSQAKGLPDGFLEDRRSVYWDNNLSKKDYSKTTIPVLTKRQKELTASKRLHRQYIGDRPSPIWPIHSAVLNAKPTARTCSLSRPKTSHPQYQPPKQVRTVIPPAALSASATQRVGELARHKTYPPLLIMEDSEWDWGEWKSQIPPPALKAVATSRVEQLSTAKKCNRDYCPPKNVQWPIKRVTLSAVASDRVKKLSQPKSKNEQYEDYDPKAWQVSPAALHAQASQRLGELSTPLPRKCRSKKV